MPGNSRECPELVVPDRLPGTGQFSAFQWIIQHYFSMVENIPTDLCISVSNEHLQSTEQTCIDHISRTSMFQQSYPNGYFVNKFVSISMKVAILNLYFRISSREWFTGEYSFDSNRIKSVLSIRLWSPTISEWFWSSAVC